MKYLVTGADGFIGRHLVEYLARNKKDTIIATDRTTKVYFEGTNIQYQACELKDKEQVDKLEDVDKVIHLAAYNGTKFFYEKPDREYLPDTHNAYWSYGRWSGR